MLTQKIKVGDFYFVPQCIPEETTQGAFWVPDFSFYVIPGGGRTTFESIRQWAFDNMLEMKVIKVAK